MMRCLIIDDEPLSLDLIEDNLKQVNYIYVAGKCRNAGEAILLMETEQIDLLFCDIGMPGINGLQFVKSLVQKPLVILVTAYEKFAVDGFELDVVDYLVKPVPLDRFLRACHKANRIFQSERIPIDAAPVIKNHFFINAEYNLLKINFNDIEYIEGLKDYVKINLADQSRPVISRGSIKALEQRLPASVFYRVHKSYIINVDYVLQIRRGKIKTRNAELPLSDNYRDMINRMIGKVIE